MATISEIVQQIEAEMRQAKARRANALNAQKVLLDSLREAMHARNAPNSSAADHQSPVSIH